MATTSLSEKTLILHGWSDCSKSFIKLKEYLVNRKSGKVETIFYGDYESREDNITFNDVIDGLNDQFIEKGFIDSNGKKLCRLNVIVHSTGGLVIRHWSSVKPTKPPIQQRVHPSRRGPLSWRCPEGCGE